MRTRFWLAVLLALGASVGGTSAAADPTPTRMSITLSGVSNGPFSLLFDSGIQSIEGGNATATTGAFSTVVFAHNGVVLAPARGIAPLSGRAYANVLLTGDPIAGSAAVPADATATVTLGDGPAVAIQDGRFSIGGARLGAAPPDHPVTVPCSGTADRCSATVPIAAGADGRALTVVHPADGFRLRSTQVRPRRLAGAVGLSRPRYVPGRPAWRATLNAPRSRKGARLTLTFAR